MPGRIEVVSSLHDHDPYGAAVAFTPSGYGKNFAENITHGPIDSPLPAANLQAQGSKVKRFKGSRVRLSLVLSPLSMVGKDKEEGEEQDGKRKGLMTFPSSAVSPDKQGVRPDTTYFYAGTLRKFKCALPVLSPGTLLVLFQKLTNFLV